MGYDISNEKGDYWGCNISLWHHVLETAADFGWQPMGTILYRQDNKGVVQQPDQDRGPIDTASGNITDSLSVFEHLTKSRKPDPDWIGTYYSNDGQVINSVDAANLAYAIRRSIESGNWKGYGSVILDLVEVLEGGEVAIW